MAKTRIDEAIHEYLEKILTEDAFSNDYVDELMEKTRAAFDLDNVYLARNIVNGCGLFFSNGGYRDLEHSPVGKRQNMTRDEWNGLKACVGEDGYFYGNKANTPGAFAGLNLCYAVKVGEKIDSLIGFFTVDETKVWTQEEKIAVKKIAIALGRFLEITRFKTLEASDLKNQIINDYIFEEYDAILLLDLRYNSFEIYTGIKSFRLDIENITISEAARRFSKIVDPEFKEGFLKFEDIDYIKDYLKNDDILECEYRITGLDNPWRRMTLHVVQREKGMPIIVVASFIGIDNAKGEKNDLIAKIEEQNNMLEEQRKKLEKSLYDAEAANRAKTAFLFNMSHDIRTPMNAITGYSALALNHIGDPFLLKDYIGKINKASAHLLELINDILDMSRIESGNVEIEPQLISLRDNLDNIRSIMLSAINAKNIDFNCRFAVKHENVFCDYLRLNQIIINLLSNSIKFTHSGGTVSLEVREMDDFVQTGVGIGKASYTFIVKDNGIGMSEDFVERIFEPFSRERTSTVSKIQGTGLGMSIVKKLVELFDGDILVESKKNVGTKFIVTLNFQVLTKDDENGKNQSEKMESKFINPEDIHILLVEDNEMNREIAYSILTEQKYKVDCAQNGKEAVEIYSKSKPGDYDLILMDVQMPIMDGHEATRQIRSLSDEGLKNIPVIAMTANAFDEDKQEAFDCGMNAFIAKPFIPEDFNKTINLIISQKQMSVE